MFVKDDLVCKHVSFAGKAAWIVLPALSADPVVAQYINGETPNSYMMEALIEHTNEGDLVLDVGCHVGTFSVMAAALNRRVIAVDANPEHIKLVRLSSALNSFRITTVWKAISSTHQSVKFIPNGLFGAIDHHGENATSIEVPSAGIDELVAVHAGDQRVRFIKMDIEGSELSAFLSANRTLTNHRPILWWESNGPTLEIAGATIRQVRSHLESLGYRTYRVENQRFVYAPPDQIQPEAWLDVISLADKDRERLSERIDIDWRKEDILKRCEEWLGFKHEHTLKHLISEMRSCGASEQFEGIARRAHEALSTLQQPSQ